VTVYLGRNRKRVRLRPTLRLRLTLLNGILLVGAGAVLVLLAWVLVGDALHPADELRRGTQVVLSDGQRLDAAAWQADVIARASRELLVKGLIALVVIGGIGIAGAAPAAQRHRHRAAPRRGDAGPADPVLRRGR
jgi:hypothetical protein